MFELYSTEFLIKRKYLMIELYMFQFIICLTFLPKFDHSIYSKKCKISHLLLYLVLLIKILQDDLHHTIFVQFFWIKQAVKRGVKKVDQIVIWNWGSRTELNHTFDQAFFQLPHSIWFVACWDVSTTKAKSIQWRHITMPLSHQCDFIKTSFHTDLKQIPPPQF
jgi:hypothetical protein